ncbi:MAG: sugar ABC transporter permease, partial [Thermoleophilia bacterium]|nr:sugar ABC transporter permease [Thermoleophilia bacterium]
MRSEVRLRVSPARRRRRRIINAVVGNPYVLVAPTVILIAIFSIRSLGFVIQKSFMKFDMVEGVADYIGFDNYVGIFTNPGFLQTLRNTFVFMSVSVIGGLTLGLICGLFLNKKGSIYNF